MNVSQTLRVQIASLSKHWYISY